MVVPVPVSARAIRHACDVAEQWLVINRDGINAINVYPVPDGDTGSNMLATWRAAVRNVAVEPDHAGDCFAALSGGALLGARGNSGVILSQMVRGMAQAIVGRESVYAAVMAQALRGASDTAYAALSQPAEGTMLTVMRDAAAAGEVAAEGGADVAGVLAAAVEAAYASVERTPQLLPALRDAGVVDAGGMGVAVWLQGVLAGLTGGDLPAQPVVTADEYVDLSAVAHEGHGYCIEFVVEGADLDGGAIEGALAAAGGESIVIAGAGSTLHIHVHLEDPGPALSAGVQHGAIDGVKVENMQAQHERWARERAEQQGGAAEAVDDTGAVAGREAATDPATLPALGLVAVAPGEGIAAAFRDLGCGRVLVTGEHGKASAGELIQAARTAGRDHVVLLPNDGDVLLAAEQAAGASEGFITVIATRSVPAGLAAALAYIAEGEREPTIAAMRHAAAATRCVEVATAVRDATVDGVAVRSGEAMALVDGRLVATATALDEALFRGLEAAGVGEGDLVTLHLGVDADADAEDRLTPAIEAAHPGVEIEVIAGGQPHYPYIAGIE